jgi:hypothetical protein
MVLCALAIPMIGLPKSPSPKPTARSIARLGARCTPSVMALLFSLWGMVKCIGQRGGGAAGQQEPPHPERSEGSFGAQVE